MKIKASQNKIFGSPKGLALSVPITCIMVIMLDYFVPMSASPLCYKNAQIVAHDVQYPDIYVIRGDFYGYPHFVYASPSIMN